jgi:flagellar basal body-associated protein FliL
MQRVPYEFTWIDKDAIRVNIAGQQGKRFVMVHLALKVTVYLEEEKKEEEGDPTKAGEGKKEDPKKKDEPKKVDPRVERRKKAQEYMDDRQAEIRDKMGEILQRPLAQLESPEAKKGIKLEMEEAFGPLIFPQGERGRLERVLFREFIIQ